uniref:mRNA 3'-end-processing protein RNA14 n=1 Tax=Moniliophthora roreri TaxID=221103 RepID=A0A0W0FHF3_MONRR
MSLNDGVKAEPSEETILQSQQSQQSTDSSASTLSEFERLEQRLRDDPHDTESWKRLVAAAEDSGETQKIRTAFDALLQQYPHTSAAQISYIEHFLDNQRNNEAEDLFKRYLKTSPRINTEPAQRDIIRKSYEFALSLVGHDKDSGDIWNDYLTLLKSGQTTSTWEEQQKMDAIRKVLHRAVQIPLDNVEKLWNELESFENNLNRITAKRFMAELSPNYMQARTVLRELKQHTANLYPSSVPNADRDIFLPTLPSFSQSERQLVGKWKAYLKWEEGNPLMLEERDRSNLLTRIQSAYRKATIRMRYFPEIWFMAYSWFSSVGKNDEALAQLRTGLEANPSSFLLNFALAEALESKKEYQEVHTVYERFLSVLRDELTGLINAEKARAEAESAVTASTTKEESEGDANETQMESTQPNDINTTSFGSTNSTSSVAGSAAAEIAERRKDFGLVYIMYMRFVRRAEGVNASRPIFGKARKEPNLTPWEVYEAAALMEYHCSGEKGVATRIFEVGMSLFGKDKDYVLRYLGFLISVNDQNNARALFERVIGTFSPEDARPLWERWVRYDYQYGDLEAVHKIEKRMADIYPNDPPIKRFAQRYTYLNTDSIALRDLGFAKAKKDVSPTNSLATIGSGGGSGSGRRRGDHRDDGSAYKRQRASSPNRERHDARRRSPERGRGRGGGGGDKGGDKDDDKPVALNSSVSWFISQLPAQNTFDGPVFRTDDLMSLLRNAVIPSTNRRGDRGSERSPPPSRSGGGRPPPDYGPYQGPNSNPNPRRPRY